MKNNFKKSLVLSALFVGGASQAATVVGYDFGPDTAAGASLEATTVVGGLTASAIMEGAGLNTFQATNVLGFASDSVLQVSAAGTSTPELSIANDAYFSFTVTPDAMMTVDLETLSFSAARGGGSTDRGYEIRSSVDNFATTLGLEDNIPTVRPTLTPATIDLGAEFSNLTTATEFRVYIFAPNGGNTIEFEDIALHGTVSVIPEPSASLLVALGGLLLARRKRS